MRVQENVTVRVARIFNTFGPRMHMNDGRVVSNFILQALQNLPVTVCASRVIVLLFTHNYQFFFNSFRVRFHWRDFDECYMYMLWRYCIIHVNIRMLFDVIMNVFYVSTWYHFREHYSHTS